METLGGHFNCVVEEIEEIVSEQEIVVKKQHTNLMR